MIAVLVLFINLFLFGTVGYVLEGMVETTNEDVLVIIGCLVGIYFNGFIFGISK